MQDTKRKWTLRTLTLGAVVLLGPGVGRAEAYIDPGTGSSLLSSLGIFLAMATTLFAAGFGFVRRGCQWLTLRFARRRKSPPAPVQDAIQL